MQGTTLSIAATGYRCRLWSEVLIDGEYKGTMCLAITSPLFFCA